MLGLLLFTIMFLITNITTLRERPTGTLERLMSMPLGKGDFIGGYTLAFGLLANAFAQTEFQVVQFMPVFVLPQILLGGIFIPRAQMPAVVSAISDWLPLSHSIKALNLVFTEADATADVLWQLGIVLAFTAAAVVLGAITLRRKTP